MLLEILPAVLLVSGGLLIALQLLGIRERAGAAVETLEVREEALREVCLAWRRDGGHAAMAGVRGNDGQWVVVVLPGAAWLPDAVDGRHLGLQADTAVTLWRRRETERQGRKGWLIEERAGDIAPEWVERMWIGDESAALRVVVD